MINNLFNCYKIRSKLNELHIENVQCLQSVNMTSVSQDFNNRFDLKFVLSLFDYSTCIHNRYITYYTTISQNHVSKYNDIFHQHNYHKINAMKPSVSFTTIVFLKSISHTSCTTQIFIQVSYTMLLVHLNYQIK